MAYFFDPNSYASTLYGAPPFMCRNPSPPPTTYYPREAADPYVRALAEEQAARAALQDAIKRECEARQRRAAEEAKAKLRERAQRRPQTMYGGYSPFGFGYPTFGYGQSYPDSQYGDDEDMACENEYPQYSSLFAHPRREAVKKLFQSVPRTARSQSRPPMNKERTPSPKPPSPDLAPKVSIPISSSSPKDSEPSRPKASPEEQNAAASKIQSAYRVHHSLHSIKSAREKFDSLLSSFTFPASLEFDLSSPPQGDERPRLSYSKTNAPVHGHEDALIKLLQALDAVESHGDRTVREKRRELVREIEKELERVDAEIRRRYEEVNRTAEASVTPSDSMEVEPEDQPHTQDSSALAMEEMEMDEDAEDKPVADYSSPATTQVEVATQSDSMADAANSQPESEHTTSEDPIIDADSDAEAEMELNTPQSSNASPLTSPIIQSDDSPLPLQVGVLEFPPELREAPESTKDSKMPVQAEASAEKSPSRWKVTIEDEDEAAERDYVVL